MYLHIFYFFLPEQQHFLKPSLGNGAFRQKYHNRQCWSISKCFMNSMKCQVSNDIVELTLYWRLSFNEKGNSFILCLLAWLYSWSTRVSSFELLEKNYKSFVFVSCFKRKVINHIQDIVGYLFSLVWALIFRKAERFKISARWIYPANNKCFYWLLLI